jgi:hypothetical protein
MTEPEEKRQANKRGVEEIDLETGESLGSPVEEGSGVRPPDEDEGEGG